MLCIFKFYYSFKLQTSYHIYFKFPSMGSPSWASLLCDNPVCRIWQNLTRSCACRFNHMHHVQYDLLYQNSGRSRRGAQPYPPPLIFRPNWGSKGQKTFFLETGLSPTPTLPPPVISRSGSSTAEYRCMPIERLSIRRMRVLGAFPVVLDGLISNFLGGACPRTSLVC